MQAQRLGIAVVAYRSEATLPRCLASIRTHCPEAYVVVVENSGDTDLVGGLARAAAPVSVDVLDPGSNVGYARGVNLAATRLLSRSCTHLLILNPDVCLTLDPLELMSWLGEADVVAGVLSAGEALSADARGDELAVSNAKREVTLGTSLVQALVGTRFTGIGGVLRGESLSVPQVDGAYMLQTMEYYRSHQFDEAFELYFEDVDYCDRARRGRGVRLVGLPAGVHLSGASAAQSSGRAYVVNRVSRARYLRRKYPKRPRMLLAAPFTIEVLVRGITRQAEGSGARHEACRLAWEELRNPGGVRVLTPSAAPLTRDPNDEG